MSDDQQVRCSFCFSDLVSSGVPAGSVNRQNGFVPLRLKKRKGDHLRLVIAVLSVAVLLVGAGVLEIPAQDTGAATAEIMSSDDEDPPSTGAEVAEPAASALKQEETAFPIMEKVSAIENLSGISRQSKATSVAAEVINENDQTGSGDRPAGMTRSDEVRTSIAEAEAIALAEAQAAEAARLAEEEAAAERKAQKEAEAKRKAEKEAEARRQAEKEAEAKRQSEQQASQTGGSRVVKAKVTAYAPFDNQSGICSDGNPASTSTGQRPGPTIVAVDPKKIPYGTKLKIQGFDRVFVAGDTGGALRRYDGYAIDVFFESHAQAMRFGVQYLQVEIIG